MLEQMVLFMRYGEMVRQNYLFIMEVVEAFQVPPSGSGIVNFKRLFLMKAIWYQM